MTRSTTSTGLISEYKTGRKRYFGIEHGKETLMALQIEVAVWSDEQHRWICKYRTAGPDDIHYKERFGYDTGRI